MDAKPFAWLDWISEALALTQAGLAYTQCEFDTERYTRLRAMLFELTAHINECPIETIKAQLNLEKGYPTPKVDVRAFVLKQDKVLLVKERSDMLWSLPGGWVDINQSPAEAAIKETVEETGFQVEVKKLLALWDKQKHDHPPQWPHIHKYFFHCDIVSGTPTPNLEISDIDFFERDKLPPLSTPRVTEKQILRLYELIPHDIPTAFD